LLGRDGELEQLGRVLAAAGAGRGGLLLLAGEAGAGKTALAEAAIGASGMAAVRGIAAQGGGAPYGPLAGALRDRLRRDAHAFDGLGRLRPHLGVLLPELGPAPGPPDRETLVEAILRAVEMIGRAEAAVVLLDDLQWADAATLELLPSLAARAGEWPLLVAGVYRSDEIPRGHPMRRLRTELRRAGRLSELVVGPLDAAATGALAAEVLGGQPGPVLRAALFDRTLGVPFFVEELAAALKAGSLLVRGRRGVELEPSARVPVPETVRDAVRLRADALSGTARRALEAAAVAGTRFEFGLLSALGEEAGLGEVLEQGMLAEAEPGVGLFRHDLVREALYADTPWPRRRALHRRLAELLGARAAEPGRVAGHWIAAAEGDRARPLLVEAARRYCAVHAYADAAAAARKALELWPEGQDEPGRVQVLDELGRCAELCGEPGEAARAWEEAAAALDRAADPRRFADAKRRLAAVYQLQGGWSKAAAARGEAAQTLAACGLAAEAAREQLLAADLLSDQDPEAALAQARSVLGVARGAADTDLEARALTLEGFAFFQLGRPAEGTAAARAALSAGLAGEHVEAAVDAYWVLATIASHWADYPAAIDAFTAAADLCRAHDMRQEEHLCLTCLALNLYSRGEWQRAEALARD
jgi:predicted ATPase